MSSPSRTHPLGPNSSQDIGERRRGSSHIYSPNSSICLTLDFLDRPEQCRAAEREFLQSGFFAERVAESSDRLLVVRIDLLSERGLCEQIDLLDRIADRFEGRYRTPMAESPSHWESVLSAERLFITRAIHLGNDEDAEHQLKRLVDRGWMDEATKSEWMGRAYLSMGKLDSAGQLLKQSLTHCHDCSSRGRSLLALGETYFQQKNYERAEELWIECLATPSANEARLALARIRILQGRLESAILWIKAAVRHDPSTRSRLQQIDEFRALETQSDYREILVPSRWQRLKNCVRSWLNRQRSLD